MLNGAAHDVYGETPRLLEAMTRFMRGDNVSDATIRIPIEFHAPDENAVVDQLHKLVLSDGAPAAIARAKEIRAPGSGKHLTSYVLVELAARLDRTDKRPADAIAVLRAGTEIFPSTPILYGRLGAALATAGDRPGAIAAYSRAVEINPLLRFYAVQLGKLQAAAP